MWSSKALYVYSFLTSSFAEPDPPIFSHFSNSTHAKLKGNPLVWIRNPETGHIGGPFPLVTWGRGFACVSTGPGWVQQRTWKTTWENTLTTPRAKKAAHRHGLHGNYNSFLKSLALIAKTVNFWFHVNVKGVEDGSIVKLLGQKCGVISVVSLNLTKELWLLVFLFVVGREEKNSPHLPVLREECRKEFAKESENVHIFKNLLCMR